MNVLKFPNLFSPIKIRGLELKNRVILPAMGVFMTDNGFVNDRFIEYLCAPAHGGCAMITPEATSVHPTSAPNNFLNISDDKFVPGLTKLTAAVHKAGAKICVQLWQGGLTPIIFDPKTIPIVPSDLTLTSVVGIPLPKPLELKAASKDLIQDAIQAFGAAAERAVKSGFDTMEMHFAHGYSPHEFLSPAFNRRTDEYGGSFENRARYPLECIRAVRVKIPNDMPLFMRIDSQDDYLEGGLTREDIIAFCKLAKAEGVDVVHVSRGNPVNLGMKFETPPIDLPRGYNVENIAAIKKAIGMLTVAVGRINSPVQAEAILAEGKADIIAIGRGQLADREFCNKAKEGRDDDIVRCIGCNDGCGGAFFTCVRNPSVGKEQNFVLTKATQPKNVAVVGGGMGGMEAAIILKQRGHNPVLFEASNILGGQFLTAGCAPGKEEMREAAESRGRQAKKAGIDIRFSTPATESALDKVKPEAVIVAIGASPAKLNLPGMELPKVLFFTDVLHGRKKVKGEVTVIGGGLVGLEVAEYIGVNSPESKITVLEMLPEIGKDLTSSRKMCVMEHLEELGVTLLANAKCKEITGSAVVFEIPEGEKSIPCDYAIIAVGSVPNPYKEIESYCGKRNIPCYIIGDAKQTRKVKEAISEATEIAMKI
jgi:2,4-dienoyl-CoA reductase-like NADH-dependent reductase (Old Yellow Enzyme family)/thioredoxin reductase